GVFTGSTRVGNCTTPNATTRQSTCGIYGTIAPSTNTRIEFNGITNPTTPSSGYTLTVATSSDPAPTSSQSYTVVPANTLTNLVATPGSSARSATTQYVISFATSPTGGLSNAGQSTIDVTFPAGTTFTNFGGASVYTGNTRVGNCTTPNATTRQSTCGIYGTIGPSTNTRIELNGVTNPSSPGSYQVTVATSSDTTPITSIPYGIAVDTQPPQTSLASGPPSTTTDAQPAFTFTSSEPGSTFECSLDGAPFTACTSPFVAPPLAAGTHTFRVRARDAAGNTDATPAGQTFTVAAPAPSTPPASPPPAPKAGKTVVVSEVGGTVRVRRKGSKAFVPLDADAGIPLGSTVDTRHGKVELTSQQKKGGAVQSATFYAGIFRVTQRGRTVNLKLTQKLARCDTGKAGAARKKKRKTRKRRLWGNGKGRFRTQGKHSAATVVGTKWLVQDSCAGTLTKVARGVLSVRDFARHKTVRVRAGKRYLAKPRR
ncbi:MAG TPA: hypothetical protein VFM58_02395, partial [Solirubrobacteraceae bacterium]|nr:hypothetical protein [Solirubrobacteraceae bacterium]